MYPARLQMTFFLWEAIDINTSIEVCRRIGAGGKAFLLAFSGATQYGYILSKKSRSFFDEASLMSPAIFVVLVAS